MFVHTLCAVLLHFDVQRVLQSIQNTTDYVQHGASKRPDEVVSEKAVANSQNVRKCDASSVPLSASSAAEKSSASSVSDSSAASQKPAMLVFKLVFICKMCVGGFFLLLSELTIGLATRKVFYL